MNFIRKTKNKNELEEVFLIRKKVFQEEQKVSDSEEFDGLDEISEHFIAYVNKKVAGCARIRETEEGLKLERIAVLREFRGIGLGKEIVKELINYCLKKGNKKIYMNAQYYLLDFYSNLGFVTEGKSFYEANIKHIKMIYKK